MSILVACGCGKRFSTKEENAGKRAKCPGCGKPLVIPSPVGVETLDDPFINSEWKKPVAADPGDIEPPPPPPPPATKTCPFCGEEIQRVAVKCKHCGEFLDPGMRQAREAPKWNPGIAALLSLLIPGIGQIYKGQVALGLFQVIGSMACYFTNVYLGLAGHVLIVLHAALAKPKSKAGGQSGPRKPISGVVFYPLFVFGIAMIALAVYAMFTAR